MKRILIDNSQFYVTKICEKLQNLGHEIVVSTGQKVYDIVYETKPDVCFCENRKSLLLNCAVDKKIPILLYGKGDFDVLDNVVGICVDDKTYENDKKLLLDAFGNKDEYGGYYQYNLESDFLFSSNFNLDMMTVIYNNYFGNHKIKFAGRKFVACPSFVGITNNEEFGSLVKSSKITVTENIFEHISIILSGNCSINIYSKEMPFMHKYLDEKTRREYIKEQAELYKNFTVDKVAEKISERIESA